METFQKNNPVSVTHVRERLEAFCEPLQGTGTPVAVVTAGGTTVPLERNCVRFIDNFSSGRRGAVSTEELLKAGYYVVHLSRKTSLQPFVRCLPPMNSPVELASIVEKSSEGQLQVTDSAQCHLKPSWSLLQSSIADKKLITVHFVTLFEYLAYLEAVAAVLKALEGKVMFVLAAAVSDFYVPWPDLPEHKIQSRDGELNLRLQQVPKCLGLLRNEWAPAAFHVSFKLETDERLLLEKSKAAITNYGVHCVVANELNSRTERVHLVTATGGSGDVTDWNVLVVERNGDMHIEEKLVKALIDMHLGHCAQ